MCSKCQSLVKVVNSRESNQESLYISREIIYGNEIGLVLMLEEAHANSTPWSIRRRSAFHWLYAFPPVLLASSTAAHNLAYVVRDPQPPD